MQTFEVGSVFHSHSSSFPRRVSCPAVLAAARAAAACPVNPATMAFAPAGANKPFGNPAATPGGGIPFGASTPAVGAAATGEPRVPTPSSPPSPGSGSLIATIPRHLLRHSLSKTGTAATFAWYLKVGAQDICSPLPPPPSPNSQAPLD